VAERLYHQEASAYYHIWTHNPRFYSLYRQEARPASICDDPDLRAKGMTRESCVIVWDVYQYIVENQVTMSHKGLVEWLSTIGGLLSILAGMGKTAQWLNKRAYRHLFEAAHGNDWARAQWNEQEITHVRATQRQGLSTGGAPSLAEGLSEAHKHV
jgi:hypothetical protein